MSSRNEIIGADCREKYSRDWGIAYGWHEKYNIAMKLWLESVNEGRPETTAPIPVVFSTPERAFADVIRPRVEGQIDLPVISFTMTGSTFDQSRFLPVHIPFQTKAVGEEFKLIPRSMPWTLNYNITVWSKFQETLDIVAYTWLSRFTPVSYMLVEGKPAQMSFQGHNDSSTLEATDTDRVLRNDYQFEVQAWMSMPYRTVGKVENIIADLTDQKDGVVILPDKLDADGVTIVEGKFDYQATINEKLPERSEEVPGVYFEEQ